LESSKVSTSTFGSVFAADTGALGGYHKARITYTTLNPKVFFITDYQSPSYVRELLEEVQNPDFLGIL
jgi:hypothetical protein